MSLFEEHTDVIVKGKRDVVYGNKINLATQEDGYVTYLNIELGNPNDQNLYVPVLKECKYNYNQIPTNVVADELLRH